MVVVFDALNKILFERENVKLVTLSKAVSSLSLAIGAKALKS
jgi:hypothetical protein